MSQEKIDRGQNIKCYDKIKLINILTGQRLYGCNFNCRSGSLNQAVACHKLRQETDWFVAVQAEQPASSHHFKYGDSLGLCHSLAKKMLHISPDIQSQVSKKMQVSLVENKKNDKRSLQQWVVEVAQKSQDQYWRVGELIMLKNKESNAYLCSHKKRLKDNDSYEVFGQNLKTKQSAQKQDQSQKNPKSKEISQNLIRSVPQEYLWRVSEHVAFIFTPSITEKKRVKESIEKQEFNRLTKAKNSISKKSESTSKYNQTEELIKMQNRRLQQVEQENKKIEQSLKRVSCWKKYICCCCYDQEQSYAKLS